MKVPRIAVGLSGGVDSAVSAAFLQHAGYRVTGIFLKVYEDESGVIAECPWRDDMSAAQDIASFLNIPFETWNFSAQYRQTVLAYFFSELQKGRTPNPDVLCNNDIKFGIFLRTAIAKGFDYIATGHYARSLCAPTKQILLLRGCDRLKDQSYFLCRLTQDMLRHALFPVGHLQKSDVRELAHAYRLPHADRKDSQGICFIGKVHIENFIQRNIRLTPGEIITTDGQHIGSHRGLPLYTVGQRHGIRIGGKTEPLYVVDKRLQTDTLIVAKGSEHPSLFCLEAILENMHWIDSVPVYPMAIQAQIRYRQTPAKATILSYGHNTVHIRFRSPQRAVTPGQFCVLYLNETLMGSGVISRKLK